MIDTISLRTKRFDVSLRAKFDPPFERRSFRDLSLSERTRRHSRVHYVRHFVLHPEIYEDTPYLPQVEIFENPDWETGDLEYELKVTCSLVNLLFDNSIQELDLRDLSEKARVPGLLSK